MTLEDYQRIQTRLTAIEKALNMTYVVIPSWAITAPLPSLEEDIAYVMQNATSGRSGQVARRLAVACANKADYGYEYFINGCEYRSARRNLSIAEIKTQANIQQSTHMYLGIESDRPDEYMSNTNIVDLHKCPHFYTRR